MANSDDIILDFFAGSGTTGHAVWKLNQEDGGNRKFILVQLDEEVQDENVKKDYPTVAHICMERLRRVSERLKEEKKPNRDFQDLGFKVFKLDQSNFNLKDEFNVADYAVSEELQKKYLEWLGLWVEEPLVPNARPLDIVYELLLKEGFNLNAKIEDLDIRANHFYKVTNPGTNQEFHVSLDEIINGETVEEIRTPTYRNKTFIFLDKALTDNQKINLNTFVRLKVI